MLCVVLFCCVVVLCVVLFCCVVVCCVVVLLCVVLMALGMALRINVLYHQYPEKPQLEIVDQGKEFVQKYTEARRRAKKGTQDLSEEEEGEQEEEEEESLEELQDEQIRAANERWTWDRSLIGEPLKVMRTSSCDDSLSLLLCCCVAVVVLLV